jgi:hypothetical protein
LYFSAYTVILGLSNKSYEVSQPYGEQREIQEVCIVSEKREENTSVFVGNNIEMYHGPGTDCTRDGNASVLSVTSTKISSLVLVS